MQKFIFHLEAETVEELLDKLENIKVSAGYLTDVTGQNIKLANFKLCKRNNKQWTEFELNFLVENYLKKNVKWIAGKLERKVTSVYAMLNILYKKGLRKKNNRIKNIN